MTYNDVVKITEYSFNWLDIVKNIKFNKIALKLTYFENVQYIFQQHLSRDGPSHSFL